jgi:hypothetical protein
MYVKISVDQLPEFPSDVYDLSDINNPIVTEVAPYKYSILAQNMSNYDCVVEVSGDTSQFEASNIVYEVVTSFPAGFKQRLVDGIEYGNRFDTFREMKQALRSEAVKEIEIAYNGNNFQGDEKSQDRMSRAINSLGITGETITWITKDNVAVQLNATDLKNILYDACQAQSALWSSFSV